mmetsp:Transcript_107039/g.307939  ORF Transcript_107039/g.307939 Transcript_107039/m.307939 type:complete len:199 (-) Transcript_107039:84-680(-)
MAAVALAMSARATFAAGVATRRSALPTVARVPAVPPLLAQARTAAVAATAGPAWSGFGQLLDKEGKSATIDAFRGRSVALYFAGHWCPMCRDFTPSLKEFMQRSPDKAIVFVSSDSSEEEFKHHRESMGADWLAIPFGSEAQNALKAKHRAWAKREMPTFGPDRRSGLPTLVVVDPATGEELKHLDAESKGVQTLQDW